MKAPPAPPPVPAPARRRFVTTRWSMVLAAGRNAAPEKHKALSDLCALYWHPVYDFVLRQERSTQKAEELTQGFFTRLLEKNDLAVAEPGRGRFRSWLLASVKHYLSNRRDYERAEKRGGDWVRVEDSEDSLRQEPSSGPTPDRVFARRWAERLLAHVLAMLREEYTRAGKEQLFDKLKKVLTGEDWDSYSRIADQLDMTAGAVNAEAFRLRRRFRELLREEVSHTVESPEDVDDELRFFISTFEAA